MAGKSGKGRNRKGSHNASSASEPPVHSNVPVKDNVEVTLESAKTDAADAAGNSTVANPEVKENETTTEGSQQKQGNGFEKYLYCFYTFALACLVDKVVEGETVYWGATWF